MGKKAVFFSTDALIALALIFVVVLLIYPVIKYSDRETEIKSDVINVLSNLKVGEIDNAYVQQLISQGDIIDLNKTILEQIGEFYANDNEKASLVANSILSSLDTNENVGIWYGSELVASKNSSSFESAKYVSVDRQVISGIQKGESLKGYSSRAFLSSSKKTEYFYFGGYVGDGNLSVNISYQGNINSSLIEITISDDYDLYINGHLSGHYEKSLSEFNPAIYDISAYSGYFHQGSNLVEFKGSKNLYIAGGYLKIVYENSSSSQEEKYYFPATEGAINLYDGFYIPNNLSSMNIYLHYLSNSTLFLNIGNKTVFNGSSPTATSKIISDIELRNLLDYNSIIGKTVPLRLGLKEVTLSVGDGKADIVFLIDTTGSMGPYIDNVVSIINNFTYALENSSVDYRLGLIQFEDYPTYSCGSSGDNSYEIHTFNGNQFTTNTTEFRQKVLYVRNHMGNGYDLPESHLRAINESLTLSWRASARKFDILLTDAVPHASDCKYSGYRYSGCMVGYSDCNCNLGPKSVISVANALVSKNITFYLINQQGGLCLNHVMDINMTNMTGGKYYQFTSASQVQQILMNIASNIANLSYANQTAVVSGNLYTKLYPDSYINFVYNKNESYYGLIATSESTTFVNGAGSFYVPENSSILEARAISYSGPKWTYSVKLNNNTVYNLSSYSSSYIALGDPYSINLPSGLIHSGDNSVEIKTSSGVDISLGSNYDKVIYTVLKSFISYSKISTTATGCFWNISMENNQNLEVKIPQDYTGQGKCSYQPGNVVYDENDAVDVSVYNLLKEIDFDLDGKIDIIIGSNDLVISSSEISGIPFTWSTEVQVRTWR